MKKETMSLSWLSSTMISFSQGITLRNGTMSLSYVFLIHCIRDCTFSRNIWNHIGFSDQSFFAEVCVKDWIRDGLNSTRAIMFAVGLWWVWRHRNSMCLNDEAMPLDRLTSNINNSAEDIKSCFYKPNSIAFPVRHIRWNNSNFNCAILNVDGSCIGTPARTGYGGLIRNSAGFYLSGFSGFLPPSADILEAELSAILHGLAVASDMGITELACYSNSLLSLNLITGNSPSFMFMLSSFKILKICSLRWIVRSIILFAKGISAQITSPSLEQVQMPAFRSTLPLLMTSALC